MHRGFVKAWRKLEDSFFYRSSQHVHLWLHILFQANHKEKRLILNGREYVCKRGQFICSRATLARDTGINQSNIERILECFESEQLIEQQANNKFRLISVMNYEQYQGQSEQQNEQQTDSKRTASEQPANTTKNDKALISIKKNEEEAIPRYDFESIWAGYPNKDGRKAAEKHFNASVKTDQDFSDIQTALSNYLNSRPVREGFIKSGATWFNNWRDWINNPIGVEEPGARLKALIAERTGEVI